MGAERSGAMNGLYHVLGGRLSAIDEFAPRIWRSTIWSNGPRAGW